jgi:hypothetical protein
MSFFDHHMVTLGKIETSVLNFVGYNHAWLRIHVCFEPDSRCGDCCYRFESVFTSSFLVKHFDAKYYVHIT